MLNFFMEMLVLDIQYFFKNTEIEINKLKLRIIDDKMRILTVIVFIFARGIDALY
jgi:hypothetical protein